jgi:hypothetical protein
MSRAEEDDCEERDGGPEISVLQEGQRVRSRDVQGGDDEEHDRSDCYDLHVVDGSVHARVGDVGGKLAGDELVDDFGALRAAEGVVSNVMIGVKVERSYPAPNS